MKLKILNIGKELGGGNIENADFDNAPSFSDYDAIIINPWFFTFLWGGIQDDIRIIDSQTDGSLGEKLLDLTERRSEEIYNFLAVTGGILICFLYPKDKGIYYHTYLGDTQYEKTIDCYSWLPKNDYRGYMSAWSFPKHWIPLVKKWDGKKFNLIKKSHPFAQYFNKFYSEIVFEAIVDNLPSELKPYPTIIATNRVNQIVSFEMPFLKGKIIFIPPAPHSNVDKLGSVFEDCIKDMLQIPSPTPPVWIDNYNLIGENKNKSQITTIDEQLRILQVERDKLLERQKETILLKGLLYEKGKLLESIIRKAFNVIGFNVLEEDQYKEEFDLFMTTEDKKVIIGEIEGTESQQMDVKKFRQLLHYIQDYQTEKGEAKGILIANANINEIPENRGEQFTKNAIKGCESYGYCRITTFEVYKIMNRLFSISDEKKENLKKRIRNEILDCKTEYKFID